MAGVQITANEAVETLKRSALPSVITEGLDDYLVFRRLERQFASLGVSLIPVGGRDEVISIFRRRLEFSQIKSAFVVDRDMWLFSGVPAEFQYPEFAITDGYSIENDLYRDGSLYNLMDHREQASFDRDVAEVARWFGYEVEIFQAGNQPHTDMHVDRIIDNVGQLLPTLVAARNYATLSGHCIPLVAADYAKILRGKTLMSLLLRYLSYKGRRAKHNDKSLMEIASVAGGAHLAALTAKIEAVFEP
jgi:hypothetical protein